MKDNSRLASGQQQLSIGAGQRAHLEELFGVMREIRRLLDDVVYHGRPLDNKLLFELYRLVIEAGRILLQLAYDLGMPRWVPAH